MKIKISLELDVSGTSYEIKNEKCVPFVLTNLGQLFQELQNIQYEHKRGVFSSPCDEETKKALLKQYDERIKILSTMFHNWTVEGETKDGKQFEFTHTEPKYQEKLKFFEK
jgi:adenine deaminase